MMWYDDMSKFKPAIPTKDGQVFIHLHDEQPTRARPGRTARIEARVADMIGKARRRRRTLGKDELTAMGAAGEAPTAEMKNDFDTGSIDKPRASSITEKTLEPGKVWGATADAMTSFWRRQREQANSVADAINRKNIEFYKRRG